MRPEWGLEASSSALLGRHMSGLPMSETETAWFLKVLMFSMILLSLLQSIIKVLIGEENP
jgi:hypothetical protein